MMFASCNVIEQMQINALDACQKAKKEMIPTLEISMDRVDAIREMAERYSKGEPDYSIPNGKFSDVEVNLWEYFVRAYRTTP